MSSDEATLQDPNAVPPNPRMQPTGWGGPKLRAGAALLVARQWKRGLVRALR